MFRCNGKKNLTISVLEKAQDMVFDPLFPLYLGISLISQMDKVMQATCDLFFLKHLEICCWKAYEKAAHFLYSYVAFL